MLFVNIVCAHDIYVREYNEIKRINELVSDLKASVDKNYCTQFMSNIFIINDKRVTHNSITRIFIYRDFKFTFPDKLESNNYEKLCDDVFNLFDIDDLFTFFSAFGIKNINVINFQFANFEQFKTTLCDISTIIFNSLLITLRKKLEQ